jgi:hypothetical protein
MALPPGTIVVANPGFEACGQDACHECPVPTSLAPGIAAGPRIPGQCSDVLGRQVGMIEPHGAVHKPDDHFAPALGQRHEPWHPNNLERIHRPPCP